MTSAGPVGPCVLHRSNCGSPAVSLLTFCSWFFSLEAPTRRVAGALPYRSGPTAGRSPRLSLRPLNISTSQVGAGAHPVTALSFFLSFFLLHLGAILFFPLSFFNKKHIELYHRSRFNVNPSVAWLTVVCFYTRFFFNHFYSSKHGMVCKCLLHMSVFRSGEQHLSKATHLQTTRYLSCYTMIFFAVETKFCLFDD